MNPNTYTIPNTKDAIKDAEAYANLMRQLSFNHENIDQEEQKIYEDVSNIQELLDDIKQEQQ